MSKTQQIVIWTSVTVLLFMNLVLSIEIRYTQMMQQDMLVQTNNMALHLALHEGVVDSPWPAEAVTER